ncbi:hypothetical protein O6H91_19G060700 [Diphasiastrum complanatum]|uniref:Uncharacterized protein n=1 Tax=Diphasiastrum complanatum TaxID=34168 RepID=A0ACC2AW22_DIPCM|nr:hypothetical protein O6H91_19G060700 [Diphasiastrum complanatum]
MWGLCRPISKMHCSPPHVDHTPSHPNIESPHRWFLAPLPKPTSRSCSDVLTPPSSIHLNFFMTNQLSPCGPIYPSARSKPLAVPISKRGLCRPPTIGLLESKSKSAHCSFRLRAWQVQWQHLAMHLSLKIPNLSNNHANPLSNSIS